MAPAEKDAKPADGGADGDQSMEDILQSIKNIIAEESDDSASSEEEAEKKPTKEPEDKKEDEVPGSDVLELTEVVEEDEESADDKEKPEDLDVLSKIDDAVSAKPAEKQAEKPAKPAEKPAAKPAKAADPATASPGDPMLSDAAEAAARASVEKLKQSAEPPPVQTTPFPDFDSGNSVEGIVASMLRPMIKQWLDENLPAIVERVVEQEIKRITK